MAPSSGLEPISHLDSSAPSTPSECSALSFEASFQCPEDWLRDAPTLDDMTALLANPTALADTTGAASASFQILTTNMALVEEAATADIANTTDPDDHAMHPPPPLWHIRSAGS